MSVSYRIGTKKRDMDLEGDDISASRPLVHHWLEDLRYLIHLYMQASFA